MPHSEIRGSKGARPSPRLFAACHVLHRLSVPRHPPDALTSRLSATPNGKHHESKARIASLTRSERPRESGGPSSRLSALLRNACRRRGTGVPPGQTLLSEDTSRRIPSTALRPHTVSRYGHTTRFFTIVHQHNAQPSPTGDATRACSGSSRRVRCWRRCVPAVFAAQPPEGEAFGETVVSPGAHQSGRAGLVEVIGLEPTTPCLQSRCSPS